MHVGRKKLHAAQIEYKKFMHCCKKEKKCYQFISSFRKLYKNYPSKTATILPLFPFKLWNGDAADLLLHVSKNCNQHNKKSVSFSGSLWLRKSGFLFFLSRFFSVAWKRISTQEVACFHSKKHKEHHHFVFMFNYEVPKLEVDWKKVEQKLLQLFFTYIQVEKRWSTINFNSAFTPV